MEHLGHRSIVFITVGIPENVFVVSTFLGYKVVNIGVSFLLNSTACFFPQGGLIELPEPLNPTMWCCGEGI